MNNASASEDTTRDWRAHPEAAERTLSALTGWLRKHPDCTFATKFTPLAELPFQLHITTSVQTHIFHGMDVQDAYAQAAQIIMFEELR